MQSFLGGCAGGDGQGHRQWQRDDCNGKTRDQVVAEIGCAIAASQDCDELGDV